MRPTPSIGDAVGNCVASGLTEWILDERRLALVEHEGTTTMKNGCSPPCSGMLLHSPWDLVLTVPERALNGTMRIYVAGPPGANVQLQRSATLTDWANRH